MAKTILCADDSVTMQKVAEITFGGNDYQYVGARSADEALKLAKGDKPALILADAVMPDKTGYDLCQMIKAEPSLADVPVIVMCGNAQPFDAARGAQVGADGHVAKPWDTQAMLDKVGELLGKAASGGVARPSAAAPAAAPHAATPAAATVPSPAARPAGPAAVVAAAAAAAAQQPPRSATIMGMPAFPMPGGMGTAPTVPLAAPAPVPSPVAAAPSPVAPAPEPAARPAAPAAARSDGRAPMIKAVTGRPDTNQRIIDVLGRMPRVADVAREAGLDPNGPEMQALLKLSYDVVERVVWEIVPELAEQLIKDKLAAAR